MPFLSAGEATLHPNSTPFNRNRHETSRPKMAAKSSILRSAARDRRSKIIPLLLVPAVPMCLAILHAHHAAQSQQAILRTKCHESCGEISRSRKTIPLTSQSSGLTRGWKGATDGLTSQPVGRWGHLRSTRSFVNGSAPSISTNSIFSNRLAPRSRTLTTSSSSPMAVRSCPSSSHSVPLLSLLHPTSSSFHTHSTVTCLKPDPGLTRASRVAAFTTMRSAIPAQPLPLTRPFTTFSAVRSTCGSADDRFFEKSFARSPDGPDEEYLESLMRKAGELTLKYSTIDADGNLEVAQGSIKKVDLCRQHDLDPRDLRKLDSMQPNLVPTILSRRSGILINMLHVRALIKADKVILFDPPGASESQLRSRLLWHLQGNIKAMRRQREGEQARLSFEHRALESILLSAANALEEEMVYTRHIVGDLLADLENVIDRDNLKRLLHYSRRLAGFQSRVKYVLAAIEEVLESDEDLSAMYLTAKQEQKPRDLSDHEELELLLESFSKQVEEIVSEVDTVVANMQSTQEIAELMLDSNRNTLIALDLKVSIATLGVGIGALTSGVFGMNLTSHLEQDPYAFYIVTGTAGVAALLVTLLGLKRLRAMRRIGINSGRFSPKSASWHHWIRSALWRRAEERANHQTTRTRDPVWMNRLADAARARDAVRAEQAALQRGGRSHLRSKRADLMLRRT